MPAAAAEKVLPLMPGPVQMPPGVAVNVTIVSVKHTLGGTLVKMMFGNGLTVMVKLTGAPVQVTPPLV